MTKEPGGKLFFGNFLRSLTSGWQQAIADDQFLPIEKSKETQCAMHVVAVRIFEREKQIFGRTLDSMTPLTSLCFDKRL